MPRDAIWSGVPSVVGTTDSTRMILLTFCLTGLQFCWGLEMTYCMPYLLELGLTKSKTSLVWVAGPLSGLIVAPVIGAVADNSKSKYGRRRPYMVGGSAAVAVCFWVLAWTTEIVEFFMGKSAGTKNITILVAVLSIYAVDFAINVVQWSCRGLLVDTLPTSKQQLGSAWASRMTALGHLVGYAIGALDLKKIFGTALGSTQFKQMTVISALSLIISVGITSLATTEKVLVSDGEKGGKQTKPLEIFREIVNTATHMPPRIRAICMVQFWAWIGWFPFLFYSSTWVGEIYFRHELTPSAQTLSDRSGEIGRIGSTALIAFSLVTSIGSIVLPWIVRSPEEENGRASLAARNKPSLVNAWLSSHLIFSCAMATAPLVTSVKFATLIVGLCGIPWAVGSWAPFTFMGVEINRLGRAGARTTSALGQPAAEESDESSNGALAGIYLGILNLFMAGPQFLSSFISMAVFALLEPGREQKPATDRAEGVNAIGACLFIGAMSSAVAAYATVQLKRQVEERSKLVPD